MLYLRVLGGAVLEDDGEVMGGPVARRHPLAVLALLATAPAHTLSRGKLVGLLWPDSPERRARRRLNTCVHQIRRGLGKEAVLSAGDDLRLDAEILGCDVYEFEEALETGDHERAVATYGGPFLDGFRLGGRSAAFEKRVDRERGRLRRGYLEALEALAQGAEERREHEVAARWWTERAAADPYDSRVALALMNAQEAAGNRAAALGSARAHAQLLEQEFGTEPSADVQALVERLESSPPRGASRPGEGEKDEKYETARVQSTIREAALDTAVKEPVPVAARNSAEAMGRPPGPAGEARRHSTARSRGRRWAFTMPILLGLLAAALVGTWHLLGAVGSDRADSTHERTLAVLPFETIGGEEAGPFTLGLRAGLLTRLSKIPQLAVISDASVVRLAEADQPLPEAASGLGVEFVVLAQVQQAASRVRVHARLVDARRDRQVWAESYDAAFSAGELFEIQGDIVRQIASALEIRLTPREERRVRAIPTTHTAAYELYLQAEDLRFRPAPTPERVERLLELYGRSLELDPGFAEARAGLAFSYLVRAVGESDPRPWVDSTIAAARAALELEPDLADAYVYLAIAMGQLGRDEEALDAFRQALDVEPSHVTAVHNLMVFLAQRGRLAEALRWAERAARLSPGARRVLRALVHYNLQLGRDDVAEVWMQRAREQGEPLTFTRFVHELFRRGRVDRARELIPELEREPAWIDHADRVQAALALYDLDWREARRYYRSLYPGRPYATSLLFVGFLSDGLGLAFALDRLGEREEAREIAREIASATAHTIEAGSRRLHLRHRMAVAHLLLGDTATALDWLERAVDAGYLDTGTAKTIPVLEPVRDHPRFQALLERMELRVAEERRRADAEGWGEPD